MFQLIALSAVVVVASRMSGKVEVFTERQDLSRGGTVVTMVVEVVVRYCTGSR